jgi:sugar lactone lactonase YvrE
MNHHPITPVARRVRLRSLAAAAIVATVAAGCAQPTALVQSGRIETKTGAAAEQGAALLATARGGPAQGKRDPRLQTVALFDGKAMPTGVTVSRAGRIFLCFPRWNDKVVNTAVELKDGQLVPFPDAATNQFDPNNAGKHHPTDHLVSVQSVVVDGRDRLWLLDPGSVNLAPTLLGGPKLWAYDLATGQRAKTIGFPNDVALKTTYLNDVRFDLGRGPEGTAYITDSGAGGIIVVDLASGASWRHLDDHPSVRPTPGLRQQSEGQAFMERKPSGEQACPDFRSDGIALSPDGKTLYYTPLASRDVYAVPTDLLADRNADPQRVAAAVRKIATKPSGNDGIICDTQGRIYTTDFEDNAIRRLDPATGNAEVIVQDERLLWPDTLAFHGSDLYVVSNQLARQPNYHFGKDERQPPYALFKVSVEGRAKDGRTR